MFFKSSLIEVEAAHKILLRFEQVSGQAINYGKSEVMFSSNIRTNKQNEIIGMLGVEVTILGRLQFLVVLNGLFLGF